MDKKKTIRTYAMRFTAGVLVFILMLSIPILASAVGDPNMGGGGGSGGGTGGGSKNNKWPSGYPDGVRVSVYKGNVKVKNSKTVDFSNFTSVDGTAMKNIGHFGQKSKKEIMADKKVTYRSGNYAVKKPSIKLPKIIKGNMDGEIKPYFTTKGVVEVIAKETGVNYNTMVNDSSYQLMIEPIIYVVYNGYPYALTATEIGYFDDGLGGYKEGHLRAQRDLQRVLFDNVPNAIYLEKNAFGINKWTGQTNDYQERADLKTRLGVGAISFRDSGLGNKIETSVVSLKVYDKNGKEVKEGSPLNRGEEYTASAVYKNHGDKVKVPVRFARAVNSISNPYADGTTHSAANPSPWTFNKNEQKEITGWKFTATGNKHLLIAHINYPNRASETNANNNFKVAEWPVVTPKIETSVVSLKAYDKSGNEVTSFVGGQKYDIKAIFRNDSATQTSFSADLYLGSATPGNGTRVGGGGNKTIAKGKTIGITTEITAGSSGTFSCNAIINYSNRSKETNPNNNFIAGTFKTVASAPVIETDTWIDAVEVFRPNKSGTGRIPVRLENLEKQGYEPLTEGDQLMIRVFYRNRSTSRTNFFANLYIGDGLHNMDPNAGPIVNGPLTEYKLWQNGESLNGKGGPSSWTISNNGIPATVILYYNVKATDTTITSRINYSNRAQEENPNDNEDIYRFTVRPNSKIETSITNISVTDLGDVPVARLLEGDTYKVKAIFKNDSEKLTSFPITISTASGNLVSTSKAISLGGTAQHEVTFTVPENSNNTITFYSDINYANRAQETNPNNNRMSITYEVIGNDLSAEFIEPNSAYREGVEVISSFYVYNHGITNIVPTHNLDIKLSAYFYDDDNQKIELQTELLQDHIVPAIGNNLAYFKWTVPEKKAAKDGKVYIECIVDPEEQFKDPDRDNNHVVVERPIKTVKISQTPMTKYERGPEPTWSLKGSSFRPRMNEFTSLRKTEFIWEEWVWENNWFAKNEYSVAIDNKAKAELEPDTHSPSREEQQNGKWMMRSGYGHYVRYVPDYVVNAPNNAWTEMQNATVHFPDLEYSSKFGEYATLEKDEDIWQLLPHPQSKYDEKLHFTKLWFPDGDYTVLTYAYDIWTPAGMVNNFVRSKEMLIDGSMYDDWGVIRK